MAKMLVDEQKAKELADFQSQLRSELIAQVASFHSHLTIEQQMAGVLALAKSAPALLEPQYRPHVLAAVVQVTSAGLSLHPHTRHAWLIPHNGKRGPQVRVDITAQGFLYAAAKDGIITGAAPYVVHANDTFEFEVASFAGENRNKLVFRRYLQGHRGPVVGAFVQFFLADGRVAETLIGLDEIDRAERAGGDVWKTDRDAMIMKTVVKRGAKWLPFGPVLGQALDIDPNEEDLASVEVAPVETAPDYKAPNAIEKGRKPALLPPSAPRPVVEASGGERPLKRKRLRYRPNRRKSRAPTSTRKRARCRSARGRPLSGSWPRSRRITA